MPTTYPEIYFPIVVQIVIAIAVAGGLIAASTLLGKRGKSPLKESCSISKPCSCIPG